tara:strand:- start:263 stop:526 length:264 start_codon:yes stop_codon:yes gene_type:complete
MVQKLKKTFKSKGYGGNTTTGKQALALDAVNKGLREWDNYILSGSNVHKEGNPLSTERMHIKKKTNGKKALPINKGASRLRKRRSVS